MNYRHAFHAGNFADVLKHATLALLLDRLKQKDTPFRVIDTHAGAGLYDLAGDQAGRTGEAEQGIHRLLAVSDLPPSLAPYLQALDPDRPLRRYPGSPLIALALMRPTDRLVTVEAHPEEARALRGWLARDKRASLHEGDGFERLPALLPPPERRGLVLIDPPYEAEDDFEQTLATLRRALLRWDTGIYAIWYPITRRAPADRFLAELPGLGREGLIAELRSGATEGLTGCGMALLNPPWKLGEALREALPALAAAMCPEGNWQARPL